LLIVLRLWKHEIRQLNGFKHLLFSLLIILLYLNLKSLLIPLIRVLQRNLILQSHHFRFSQFSCFRFSLLLFFFLSLNPQFFFLSFSLLLKIKQFYSLLYLNLILSLIQSHRPIFCSFELVRRKHDICNWGLLKMRFISQW